LTTLTIVELWGGGVYEVK